MSQYPYHPPPHGRNDEYNNPFYEDNASPPFLRPSPVSPLNPHHQSPPPPPSQHFPRYSLQRPASNPFAESTSYGGYESLPPNNPADRSPRPGDLKLNTVLKRTHSHGMAKWKTTIHWYVPTAMVVVFLLGCGGALAHHFFYSHLHGQPAEDQIWKNRYGTAIAFFTKACLVGSVVLSYRQRVWQTVRQKAMTLRGLDALFSIIEDPAWFVLSGELYRHAKMATLMGLMAWLIPLAAVVAPGSLTAEMILDEHNATCNVLQLNFTNEAPSDWRSLPRPGFNLAFFDTAPPPPTDSSVDYYNQPSFQAERMATLYAFAGPWGSPEEKISPCDGFNCTYTLSFRAPSYNCSIVPIKDSPFNISNFAPNSPPTPAVKPENMTDIDDQDLSVLGNSLYKFFTNDTSDYIKGWDKPHNTTTYQDQGTFTAEPPLWFGIAVNTTQRSQSNSGYDTTRWEYELVPTAYKCIHQMAEYEVITNWTNDAVNRTYVVKNGVDILPQGETRAPVPRLDPTNRNDTDPRHAEYREFLAAHALSKAMQKFISRDIRVENWKKQAVTASKVTNTKLVDNSSQPVQNFDKEFEKFYQGFVLSLFSEPDLVVMNHNRRTDVTCLKHRYQNQFQYQARSLWIGYSMAIAAAFVALCFGFSSIMFNGMTSDIRFSKIMVTTRNSSLDGLVKSYPGASLGGDPVPLPLETTRLRFGVIDNWATKQEEAYRRAEAQKGNNGGYMGVVEMDQWPKHTAFGLEDEVVPIGQGDVENSSSAIAGLEGTRGDNGQNIELRRRQTVPGSGLGVLYGA